MAELSFNDITKRFPDGTLAVDELNLSVEDGEFVVFVGPSGCGKSTSLRMAAGLEEISSGQMLIDGQMVNHLSPRDRDIAMVFQSYALYPHMTVNENMGFALKLAKLGKQRIAEQVKTTAEILGLKDLLHRKPRELSGGQRQRVAMGRAIVRKPKAFLMDEPLSNLDAKLRVQMRGEISRLQENLGITTLYVTHDQVEAMTMGDRVAVLRLGELQQYDTPVTLYQRPANLFVASFLGSPSMNLCKADLARDDEERLVVRFGSQELRIPDAAVDAYPGIPGYVGRRIALGIRPESLFRPPNSEAEGRTLRLEVDLVEVLGAEALVHLKVDAEAVPTEKIEQAFGESQDVDPFGTLLFVGTVSPKVAPERHDVVDVHVETEDLHFFDLDSGATLR